MTAGHSVVELPHARLAGGPRTLLVLQGLTLENKAPSGRALRLLRWAYKRYLPSHTVFQVGRRSGLPAGATTRDMAGDSARWTQGRFDGPVDVVGFSTGGEVAQYLAADHGELVGRLVLSDTGCRLGEDAKALLRAARDKAARGRAAGAQADVAAHMDFGRLGGGLVRLLGKRMMKEPGDPSDYIATLDADLAHDATEALPRIDAPTPVIAGTQDFFYPEPIVRETAERVPNATLRLYEGVGHPVGRPASAGSRTTSWRSWTADTTPRAVACLPPRPDAG
ncbi:MAG TPA: alpha/beta hydrolase [Actinomycetes bacterium]